MVHASASHVLRLDPVSGPLAGRAGELDRLRAAWQRAAAGTRQLVLLAGEGGVGKTRLAAELACEAEAAGATVLLGGWPPAGAEPCQGLVEALGPVAEGHGAVPKDRDALFRAMADELARRSERSPVVLVLDDLHRADRTTFLALRHILDMPGRSAVLVVGAYRDGSVARSHPLAEFFTAVRERGDVDRLLVEGLSPPAVGELVGDPVLGSRIWRQSAGNPLLAGELLRAGALDGPLPSTFEDLVAGRVARLDERTVEVLEAAAVIGQRFTVPVLAAATRLPQARVAAALRDAAAVGLVVEDPGSAAGHRFAHDMVREAVEGGIPLVRRAPLHLAVGKALARIEPPSGASPAVLAWHFRAGAPLGGSMPAVRFSSRAGDRAMELLAWDEAATHYSHALAALPGAVPATRTDLLLSLGEAQRRAGEPARARQSLLEAADVARCSGDGDRLARAAQALGRVSAVWGDDDALARLAGEARALGQDVVVPAARAHDVDFATGDLYDFLDGKQRGDGGAAASDPGAAPPATPSTRSSDVAVLRARHRALAGPEHVADRLAAADELVTTGEEQGDDELVATGRGWRMLDLLRTGRVAEAAVEHAAHAGTVTAFGPPQPRVDAAVWAAMWALLEGNADEARTAVEHALVVGTAAGDVEATATYWMQRWAIALEWGTAAELSEVVEGCRRQAATAAAPGAWRASLALLLTRGGHIDLAAEELRRAADGSMGALARDPDRLHALTCVAEAGWTLGDVPHASLVAPLLEPFAGQLAVARGGVACLGSVARACGLAAATAHRWDDAERHYKAALDVHSRIGAPALLARTQDEWSQVLAARGRKGDRRRAADARRKSQELATRLRMDRLRL